VYYKLECTNLKPKSYSGHKVPMVGQMTLPVSVGKCRHEVTFVIVKQVDRILGKDACVQLGIVSRTGCMNVNMLSSRGIPSQTVVKSL